MSKASMMGQLSFCADAESLYSNYKTQHWRRNERDERVDDQTLYNLLRYELRPNLSTRAHSRVKIIPTALVVVNTITLRALCFHPMNKAQHATIVAIEWNNTIVSYVLNAILLVMVVWCDEELT
jgi:hypothetical protein